MTDIPHTPEPKPRLSIEEYLRRMQEIGARVIIETRGGVEFTSEAMAHVKPTQAEPPADTLNAVDRTGQTSA